jgi:hypothetical protein
VALSYDGTRWDILKDQPVTPNTVNATHIRAMVRLSLYHSVLESLVGLRRDYRVYNKTHGGTCLSFTLDCNEIGPN